MVPLVKTIVSIKKSNLIGIMLACAVLAVIVVVGAVGLISWLAAHFVNMERGWLETLIQWAVPIITGIGGWFMLPVLTVLIAGFFQETAIRRVEGVYYPDAASQTDLNFWIELWHDIKFTLWALFLNLLILPLYLIGGLGFAVSIALNSYLLGREFFESAAGFHMGKPEAKAFGRDHKKIIYAGGFFITLMTLTPILNCFVPIIAVVWMVHVYHGITGDNGKLKMEIN